MMITDMQYSSFQCERHSLLIFDEVLCWRTGQRRDSCVGLMYEWMVQRWMECELHVLYLSLFSQSSFTFLSSLCSCLPSYISFFVQQCTFSQQDYIYCLWNNIWVFMSACALEWMCWTFACIFVRLSVWWLLLFACGCVGIWVCVCVCVCKMKAAVFARLYIWRHVSHIYGFVHLHVCTQ